MKRITLNRRPAEQARRHRRLVAERLESRWLLAGMADDFEFAEGEDAIAPDFAIVDLNANSDTYEDAVSPRDYLQQVSGWYFTYAT